MHCRACDRTLASDEIKFNEDLKDWELCGTCLTIALETANGGGFKIDDDDFEQVEEDFDAIESWAQMTELEHRDDFLFERGYD